MSMANAIRMFEAVLVARIGAGSQRRPNYWTTWVVASCLLIPVLSAQTQPHTSQSSPSSTKSSDVEPLLAIKKVCVDKIVGSAKDGDTARELVLSALFAGRRLVVTENCDKADGILRGAILLAGEKRVRAEGEGISFGAAGGSASSGGASFGAAGGGANETLFSSESRTQASMILRLVDRDGVVVWATTQDSSGGKAKAAAPDAVERAVKQLFRDLERAGLNK